MKFFKKSSLLVAGCLCAALVVSGIPHAKAAIIHDPAPPANLPDPGPAAPLVSAVYSQDGNTLYTLDEAGELRGRNIKTRKTVFKENVGNDAQKLRFMPDGSLLVARDSGDVTWYDNPSQAKRLKERFIFLRQKIPLSPKAKRPPGFPPLPGSLPQLGDVLPSPDGTFVAEIMLTNDDFEKGDRNNPVLRLSGLHRKKSAYLIVWNAKTKSLAHAWKSIHHLSGIPHLAWNESSTKVLLARPNIHLLSFDPQTGDKEQVWAPPKKVATFTDPEARAKRMEKRLSKLPPGIRENAMRAQKRKEKKNAHKKPKASFGALKALSRDGKILVSATNKGWQFWNRSTNSHTLLKHTERFFGAGKATISHNGKFVVARRGTRFYIWKADGTQLGWARVPFSHFTDATFSPQGKFVTLSDDTGAARQWQISAPLQKAPNTTFEGYFAPIRHVSVSKKATMIATDRSVATLGKKVLLRWFANKPIETTSKLTKSQKNYTRLSVTDIAVSPDGKHWAETVAYSPFSGSMQTQGIPAHELRMRKMNDGSVLWRKSTPNPFGGINFLRFLSSDLFLIGGQGHSMSAAPSINPFGGIHGRNVKTGKNVPLQIQWKDKRGFERPAGIDTLEISNDKSRIALTSGSGRYQIQTVNTHTKKIFKLINYADIISIGDKIFSTHGKWAISPDGKWLARTSEAGIETWRLIPPKKNLNRNERFHSSFADNTIKTELPGTAISFGKDNTLVVGFKNGRVKMWKPGFGEKEKPSWVTEKGRAVEDIQFSADGKSVLIADQRGNLKARNAKTGELQSTLRLLPPDKKDGHPTWIAWTASGHIIDSRGKSTFVASLPFGGSHS